MITVIVDYVRFNAYQSLNHVTIPNPIIIYVLFDLSRIVLI